MKIRTISCSMLCAALSILSAHTPVSYTDIANLYLPQFAMISTEDTLQTTESESSKPTTPSTQPQEPVTVTEHDAREIVFNLFAQELDAPAQTSDPVIMTLVKDLEIFASQDEIVNAGIFSTINRTTTSFGEAKLAHLLANPSHDLTLLGNRQKAIATLLNNPELAQRVQEIMHRIYAAEKSLFLYWKEGGIALKNPFFDAWITKKAAANTYALEALVRLCDIGLPLYIATPFAIMVAGRYAVNKLVYNEQLRVLQNQMQWAQEDMQRYQHYQSEVGQQWYAQAQENFATAAETYNKLLADCATKTSIKTTLTDLKDGLWWTANPKNVYNEIKKVHADIASDFKKFNGWSDTKANNVALGMLGLASSPYLIGGYYFLKGIKTSYNNLQSLHADIALLHDHLILVADILNGCAELTEIMAEHPDLARGLLHAQELQPLAGNQSSADFAKLVRLLSTDTFTGKSSFFSHAGRIIAAHELMKRAKTEFAPTFEALGEIDACLAIAKLCAETACSKTSFCYAHYIDSSAPLLAIDGFWHPLVNPEKVVKNSITLGMPAGIASSGARDVVLTGSNTGGKSTVLKSMLLSLLMAQTCTIAPASSMTLTPFTIIGSYLHVLDNTAKGDSLFMAEVKRANSLIEKAQGLGDHEFGFVVIDELFTGTGPEKGAAAAYKVAHTLCGIPNIMYVLATHFPLLTSLEEATSGLCKNYKLDVIKHADGRIERPFKLEPGISTVNIAEEILHEHLHLISK